MDPKLLCIVCKAKATHCNETLCQACWEEAEGHVDDLVDLREVRLLDN